MLDGGFPTLQMKKLRLREGDSLGLHSDTLGFERWALWLWTLCFLKNRLGFLDSLAISNLSSLFSFLDDSTGTCCTRYQSCCSRITRLCQGCEWCSMDESSLCGLIPCPVGGGGAVCGEWSLDIPMTMTPTLLTWQASSGWSKAIFLQCF